MSLKKDNQRANHSTSTMHMYILIACLLVHRRSSGQRAFESAAKGNNKLHKTFTKAREREREEEAPRKREDTERVSKE